MKERYTTIVVGAGLAGAVWALWASRMRRVLVLDAEDAPAQGASGAAAGLAHPMPGVKAKLMSHAGAALGALHATLAEADADDLWRGGGVLRPARDAKQQRHFQQRAEAHPEHARWLTSTEVLDRYGEHIAALHGTLLVLHGGALDVAALVGRCLAQVQARGGAVRLGTRVTAWGDGEDGAWIDTDAGERLAADDVLLAPGQGVGALPEIGEAFGLHRVKGQTVRVAWPEALPRDLPLLAGHGYVVPERERDTLVVGATYEHTFDDLAPTEVASRQVLRRARAMLPALADAKVLEAQAGARVSTPDRRPILTHAPGCRCVRVFTGLGSKGLLLAPRLARADVGAASATTRSSSFS